MADELNLAKIREQLAVANNQRAPITEDLKQKLQQPETTREKVGSFVRAAAELVTGKPYTQLSTTRKRELNKLREASKVEQIQLNNAQKERELRIKLALKNNPNIDKQQASDMVALERMQGIVAGNNSRKGKLIAKGRDRIKSSNIMLDMIKKFDNGSLTFDDPSNTQYAAAFAKLMGTASGIEIVNKFKYQSAYGAIQDFRAWLSGDPKTTVTDEMMKEIRIMSHDMARNEQETINKAVARELTSHIPRLSRNPDAFQAIVEDYQNDAGEVVYDPKTNRFKPVLTRDISVLHGGQSVQPDPIFKKSPKDQQALDWANANQNDPRAAKILQKLGR